jgi:hypothetical protein
MPADTEALLNGRQWFRSAPSRAHQRVEYTGHALELAAGATLEDALDFMTRLSTQCYSAECAPYAFRLERPAVAAKGLALGLAGVRGAGGTRRTAAELEQEQEQEQETAGWDEEQEREQEQEQELSADNGEFSAGAILASCLRQNEKLYGSSCKREGEGGTGNLILVVTRKVQGCFVADSVQALKYGAIRRCATQALALLHHHLATRHLPEQPSLTDSVSVRRSLSGAGTGTRSVAKATRTRPVSGTQTLPMPPGNPRKLLQQKSKPTNSNEGVRKKEAIDVDSIPDFAASNTSRKVNKK